MSGTNFAPRHMQGCKVRHSNSLILILASTHGLCSKVPLQNVTLSLILKSCVIRKDLERVAGPDEPPVDL